MNILAIFDDCGNLNEVIKEYDSIVNMLSSLGVRFERWETPINLSYDASQEEIINAYKSHIDRINQEYDFKSMDVVSINPDNPKKDELRTLFIKEHTHSDFEVRFFVDGSGSFYLHINNKVYVILCQKGDFISVPANIKHWYDMGSNPYFKAIRFFSIEDGWVANFTDSNISYLIKDHDQISCL